MDDQDIGSRQQLDQPMLGAKPESFLRDSHLKRSKLHDA
jgi:hypothetical protein